MAVKSERVEIRLDVETLTRVDQWSEKQDDRPSRSEAIRRLIEGTLEGHTTEGFRLNNPEKLMTWLLTSILKNQIIKPSGKFEIERTLKEVDLIQESIFGGHFWALNWELSGVMHNHADDPKAVRAVVDILDMWDFIELSYEQLSDDNKAKLEEDLGVFGNNPRFSGFDGNNESEYMSIARFLVEKMDRFSRFKGRDFNSHYPTVERYRRMATLFDPIRVNLIGRPMNYADLSKLLKVERD